MLALVPQAMNAMAFSVQAVSFVGAAYFAGFFAGAWRGEAIMHSVGHVRTYAGLIALIIVSVLALPFFDSPWIWFALRFLHGFAAGGAFLTIEAWMNGAADTNNRGRVLASYMVVTLGGLGISQFLASAGDVTSLTPVVIGGILFAASIIPVVLTRIDAPQLEKTASLPLGDVYKNSPFGFVIVFAVGMCQGAFWAIGPFFAAEAATISVSAVMALAVFAGLLYQWPTGYFSDKIDRRLLVAVITAVVSIAAIVAFLIMSAGGAWMIYVFFIVLGAQFCLYPVAMAHAVSQAPDRNASLGVARGLIMAVGLGQTVGPLVAGPFVSFIQPAGLLVYFAVLFGGMTFYSYRRMNIGAQVVPGEQQPFVFTRMTTPIGAEIDPRTADSPPIEGSGDLSTDEEAPRQSDPSEENMRAGGTG